MAAAPDLTGNRTLTLLLVRHGETAWNHEGRLQGWQDVLLSSAGHEQARRLAVRLARTWQAENAAAAFIPGPPCALYSSDLSRAFDTACAISKAIAPLTNGVALPVQKMEALRERHFGEREGFTAAEAKAKWGTEASHKNVGETYTKVNERMAIALQTIWDKHAVVEGKNVVLVTGHGGASRLWLCRAGGRGPESVQRFYLDNTGLSIITFTGPTLDESEGRILLCNDTAHLQTI